MQFKYTDEELELIKKTFADNEELLIVLRKFLLQANLNAVELSRIELLKGKEIVKILRKVS